jgi:hypothetical protein
MKNAIISSVRNGHYAGLNSAAKMEANRQHSLNRESRKTVLLEKAEIASVSQLFNLERLTDTMLARIEFWLSYLQDYGSQPMIETEHVDDHDEFVWYNPIRKALREARSHESGKNRHNEMDVVDTCFLVFLQSVDNGADKEGNLIRETEVHKNCAYDRSPAVCDDGKTRNLITFGRNVKSFQICENVDHLFNSSLRWAVKRVLKMNSGSVDVSATAEKGYLQSHGMVELEQAMDILGTLNDNDKLIRRDLSIGFTQDECAKRNKMSRHAVRKSIGRLQTAARIVTGK